MILWKEKSLCIMDEVEIYLGSIFTKSPKMFYQKGDYLPAFRLKRREGF